MFYRLLPMLGLLPALLFAQNSADLVLEDAWVRALPPTQSRTAAYVSIYNRGAAAVEILSVSAQLAGRTEIHTSREVDGLIRMEQLQGLSLAAGQRETLTPGGTHLMLLELERMPAAGESVELCFQIATGETVCTSAEVRKTAPENDIHHHH